jgi:hypothetical protein
MLLFLCFFVKEPACLHRNACGLSSEVSCSMSLLRVSCNCCAEEQHPSSWPSGCQSEWLQNRQEQPIVFCCVLCAGVCCCWPGRFTKMSHTLAAGLQLVPIIDSKI